MYEKVNNNKYFDTEGGVIEPFINDIKILNFLSHFEFNANYFFL
jgi:hypothetical protein